ncbi:MAG: LysR family transcriptional regulator [Alphaproteobacteria bacterium]|nr:LysR family transcriptional regulator [Alphaproteobacteria bacterium]
MDINLARTFLTILETGSFITAAEKLHVTQSTVSTRIRSLEDGLGIQLFERGRGGASPTPAGERFQRHAIGLVRIWEQAQLEVSLPEEFQGSLVVGAQVSLWEGFLLNWLAEMSKQKDQIAVRAQFGSSDLLMRRLIDGVMDIGVMYTPEMRPGFKVDRLFSDEIVLVSSEKDDVRGLGARYIYVDWGPEFQQDHSLNFPEATRPGIHMELGVLGLGYLLENEATGYFPKRLAAPFVEEGRLRILLGAPVFTYPAYVVYSADAESETLKSAVTLLKRLARRL